MLPVTVTRKKSIRLVRKLAAKNEKLVGVVAQRHPDADEPTAADLYPVGTLARILKLIDQPDDTVTIIIQGQVRFVVGEELTQAPQLTVQAAYFEEKALDVDQDGDLVLLQSLREAASKVLENDARNPDGGAQHARRHPVASLSDSFSSPPTCSWSCPPSSACWS